MNEAIKKLIQEAEAAHKPEDSLPWEADKPFKQALHTYNPTTDKWEPTPSHPFPSATITQLALFSWNIDFMLPHSSSRMNSALSELSTQLRALPPSTASVIFLQECTPSDLDVIGATNWVRSAFARTDVNSEGWASGMYGTTTLVDKRLSVKEVFRVHFSLTKMERDALFVDIMLQGNEEKKIRFCNAHLESLAREPAYRPPQAALAAKFMREEGVHGAVLAGDLNAIEPFDRSLHSVNNLYDAYLSLGGAEDSEEGYTWGQQAAPELRQMYGCSRMDKVWYCGGVTVPKFARFGADVEVDDDKEKKAIKRWGGFEKAWVTDHLGVRAVVDVVD
ncbi:Endonuclease/exonuclease/phosphatase [Xylaria curta]|nr:Endonuclease/exonuclease/phosphatase [Xylaria curta]